MRNLRYQTAVGFIIFILFNSAYAELIYGFNGVTVSKDLKTSVEFDQSDFKNFQKTDQLKLQVMDGKNIVREDAILNNGSVWVWNKVLPFSVDLKFLILKDGKPISTEYFADTKNKLQFSENKQGLPFIIKGIHFLPAIPIAKNNEKKRLSIDVKEFKNCKDKVLVVVFNKETNTLIWQRYAKLKNQLTTDEIEFSKNMQPTIAIVTDEGSCGK